MGRKIKPTKIDKATRNGFRRYYRWAVIDGAGLGLVGYLLLGLPWWSFIVGAIGAFVLVRLLSLWVDG